MPIAGIIMGAVQLLDIIAHAVNKYPAEADALQAGVPILIGIASRSIEETEEETKARLDAHAALVAKYSAPPVSG